MKDNFSPQLVDLYCDLASHLVSLPEVQALGEDVVAWLAERIFSGLPDSRAWDTRPHQIINWKCPSSSCVYEFMFADTDNDEAKWFIHHMKLTVEYLANAGLPLFPRAQELEHPFRYRLYEN